MSNPLKKYKDVLLLAVRLFFVLGVTVVPFSQTFFASIAEHERGQSFSV